MKYTKNLNNKLLNRGYKFLYNHTDEEINYDVLAKGPTSVTLDHTNKEVVVNLTIDDEALTVSTINQLDKLDNLLTQVFPNTKS